MRALLIFLLILPHVALAAPKPPAAPDGLTVTGVASTSIGLKWYASKGGRGAITYYIFRGMPGVPVSSFLNVGSTTLTSYTDSGVAPATSYQYVIQARDSAGSASEYTAPVLATTACVPPGGLLVTGVYSNSVALAWTAPTGCAVSSYDVYRNGSQIGSTKTTAFTDATVAPGTAYQYAVRAHDTAGNVTSFSSSVTATTACAVPAAPSGLVVTSTSSSAVSLQWNAPPPTGCTVTYTVYKNYSPVASGVSTKAYTVIGLDPSTTYPFSVSASNSAGTSAQTTVYATTAAVVTAPGFPTRLFAPYTDMVLSVTPSLTNIATQTGQKYFSLAFIVAASSSTCRATWGTYHTMSEGFLSGDIASLRNLGGDVIPSLGGSINTELALACSDVSSLQAQYQSVIDAYNVTRLDFDIEGSAMTNTAANDRRAKAIRNLQAAATAKGKNLAVQFTIPVMPSGLTSNGMSLLQNAINNGVDIAVVNVMAMDYGSSYTGSMGNYAVQAMTNTISQLTRLYAGTKTASQVSAMVGVTPMIGWNDFSGEVFYQTDASTLLSGAQANGIGFLSMWSTSRDQQCPSGPTLSPVCSGILQYQWDFLNTFRTFTAN